MKIPAGALRRGQVLVSCGQRIHELQFASRGTQIKVRTADNVWHDFVGGEGGETVSVEDWPEDRVGADCMTEYTVSAYTGSQWNEERESVASVNLLALTRQEAEALARKELRPQLEGIKGWFLKTRRCKPDDPVVIGLWKPHPTKLGYAQDVGRRTIQEVYSDLMESLGDMVDEYFSIAAPITYNGRGCSGLRPDSQFPEYMWIECSAVTGGSEGHYVRVRVMLNGDEGILMFLGKTFLGLHCAYKIAEKVAVLLDA